MYYNMSLLGLDLSGYVIQNVVGMSNDGTTVSLRQSVASATTISTGASGAIFQLELVPTVTDDIRKPWVFRTDTALELAKWLQIFEDLLGSSNGEE
jgi:hypothetical protein